MVALVLTVVLVLFAADLHEFANRASRASSRRA
jgi:hypothetical protein